MRKYPKFILLLFAACLIGGGMFYFSNTQKEEEIPTQTTQNIKLLTSHSHPEAGENWVVSFETIGTADLTIIPKDPDTINDLDFASMKCAPSVVALAEEGFGEELNPEIKEGDVLFLPNWSCDGVGVIAHLVNIARKHTLKFQFGNKLAFAYNNPDSVTDTFDDESKIASKENITVTGGQVRLSICGNNGTACSGAGECCSGYCTDGYCCNNDCTGLCKTCSSNDGGTAGTCHNTNDNYDLDNECAGPSYNACSNQYTRIGPDGYCDGSGACDTNDNTAYVSVGDVCYQGSSVDPSGNTNCGTGAQNCYCDNDWYQCDAVNDCTYDRYYVGFNNGASCIQTGAVERTANVTNPAGYRCNTGSATVYELYTSIMDTNACATCKICSSGTCANVAECENCYGCLGSCYWCNGSGVCKTCSWQVGASYADMRTTGTSWRCKPSTSGQQGFRTSSGGTCSLVAYPDLQPLTGSTAWLYTCSCQ